MSKRRKEGVLAGASIRVVAQRTGIAPETLRMWERRYGFPKPERRPSGTRVYDEATVERLLVVSRAMEVGFRPGEVVPLEREEVERLIGFGQKTPPQAATPIVVAPSLDAVMDAVEREDPDALRTLLRNAALTFGPIAFVRELAHPLLLRVGEEWMRGKLEVRHEHLVSAALMTQLRLLLGALAEGNRSPTVLLATLPGEPHVLGLDLVAVVLAANLAKPQMLGADTPPDQIAAAAAAVHADAVGISVSAAADPKRSARDARALLRELPRRTELWIGGEGAASLGVDGARVITTWDALDEALRTLRARTAA